MKAFAKKINRNFKKERNFIKYTMSLIANSFIHLDTYEILRNLFRLLLRKYSDDASEARIFLEEKTQTDIESYKHLNKDTLENFSEPGIENENNKGEHLNEEDENDEKLPIKEDDYLQQSKRSVFFKECQTIFKRN